MNDGKLTITPLEGGALFEVSGRANFETAMPLRDYVEKLSGREVIWFAMAGCTGLDSTFMGVMAMLALKAKRSQCEIHLAGADAKLCGLLAGIGILKLFAKHDALPENLVSGTAAPLENAPRSEADRAQTVLDAHKTLVEADGKNAEVFKTVIELAEDDVNRLKK